MDIIWVTKITLWIRKQYTDTGGKLPKRLSRTNVKRHVKGKILNVLRIFC